jgi:peptidoglycan/LPS O-acetylase OafA/YrhL
MAIGAQKRDSSAEVSVAESIEHQLNHRTPGRRILALDALRGLAALSVVFIHFRAAFNELAQPHWYLLPIIGGNPVGLFFVLSGYVLSIPFWLGRQPSYPAFLVRRFFRIYVPYAGAVLIALLAASRLLYSHLPLTPWFYRTWQSPLTCGLISSQLLTISTTPKINAAFWSLRYEMEMSLVFPAVCWALARMRLWGAVVATIVIQKAGYMLYNHPEHPVWQEFGAALAYGSYFLYGAIIAWKGESIAELYHKAPRWLKYVILGLVIVGYFGSKEGKFVPLACCGIIILALHSRVSRLLDTAVPEYLGRISYSMYLLHATVLWATAILLYGKIPLVALGLVYGAATLVISHLSCVFIEEPAMRFGKQVTGKKPGSLQRFRWL